MRRVLYALLLALSLTATARAQVIGQPTTLSAQSSSACSTTNAFIAVNVGNAASVSFGITGTWSGTLTFYGTTDGSTWVAVQVTNLASGTTPVTTTTANGNFGLSNPGFLSVCVDFTTRSSGTATVTVTRGWSARGGGAGNGGGVTGGTCTNQVVTAVSTSGVPTCTTVTSAYKDTSIASTGVDINTSYQVTATHLASALPVTQGGWGLATLAAHNVYVGNGTSAPTAIPGGTNCVLTWSSASVDPTCAASALGNGTSFTPAVAFGGGTTGITYTLQVGRYVVNGNVVTFTINIVLSSKGSSTGAATITGLPVAAANVANVAPTFAVYPNGMAVTVTQLPIGLVLPNATTLQLFMVATGSVAALDNTNFSGTDQIRITGSYITN
jgi:hypothetical protein